MAELIILGASNAIPTAEGENTHFVFRAGSRTVLVDVASSPLLRLDQAGIDQHAITDLVLTHFHPDHVGGLPLFLMDLWLLGRKTPLVVHGLADTLDRAQKLMELFGWAAWPGFFQVVFNRLPATEMTVLLETPELRVFASPVKHLLPTIGLRVEFCAEQKTLAYSCDTEVCPAVAQLAQGVDILLHEASGPFKGHSSAAQAGEVAARAGARALYLIHYPTGKFASGDPLLEARQNFSGPITLARDLMRVVF